VIAIIVMCGILVILKHLQVSVVEMQAFITSSIDGDEWSTSLPGRFALVKSPLIWDWVDLRSCLTHWRREKSLPQPEIKARSSSL